MSTTKILVLAHGELASGLLDSAAMICGDVACARAVSFRVGESPEQLRAAVEGHLSDGTADQVLFVVDLPGGTPARVAAELAARGRGETVTGANLPMVIEVILAADHRDAAGLAELAVEKGREGVIDAGQQIRAALTQRDGSTEA